jgi:hypothetical protein
MAKVFKKSNNNDMKTIQNENNLKNKDENEERNAVISEEKQNEVVVHRTKKTIHNQ